MDRNALFKWTKEQFGTDPELSLIHIFHGDAVGGAHLILPAVALADGAGIVVVHHKVLGEHRLELPALVAQLIGQGQHGGIEGSQGGVEAHDHTDIVVALLVLAHHFLVVGLQQEGQGMSLIPI